jgi:predicted PurR-regulated permease PerM
MAIVFGPNKMTKSRTTLTFLMVLTAIALYFCYLLVAPFLKPIIFSSILAIIFYPLQARVHRLIRNRHISALLSTIVVILLITLLSIFLGRAIVSGLGEIYQSLRGSGEGRERLSLFIVQFIDRAIAWTSGYVPISAPDLQKALLTQVEKVIAGLVDVTAGAFQSITSLAVNALMTLFILFFLLRDGRSMLRRGAVILPLKPNQVTRLYRCVKDTLNAIVYGTLAIAAVQGTLTGLAFWVLGVSSPVIWGVVTTLCALLPIVGTTFVLLPAMFMLILGGHWVKGLILLIWGIFVVHPVDNVLRPYLIGEHTKLSTLYVFFAVLGGLKTFGGLGVFIGPLVLAVTVALFRFLREEKRAGTWSLKEDGG